MEIKRAHCLFEQSGTFKNEFIKLGVPAEDYDILNDFGETDHIIDLYAEIRSAYERERETIFDKMEGDLVFAFFPCIRFEAQIIMGFQGNMRQHKGKSDVFKLEYDLKLGKELAENYELVTKLALLAYDRNFKLIIENPYSTQHYLYRYWCLKPAVIDFNRRDRGDAFEKPTQYWFINCEPSNNFIFEPVAYHPTKKNVECNTVERSMITKDYANRFIREFIL